MEQWQQERKSAKRLSSILVVEDNDQDYVLEKKNLEIDGFQPDSITRARCLAEAGDLIGKNQFDAIILDMNVGDSSGIDTFRRVYAMANDIPIVILSGTDSDHIANVAMAHGAQDFVHKKDLLSINLKKILQFASDRNEMLKAIKKSREDAQRHTEFKTRFLAQMSHEIRTPMNGVIGIAQLLSLSAHLSDDDKNLVNTLKATSKHLIDLISDILDLSKIEAGKTVLENVSFNIRGLVEDSIRSFIPIAEEKDLVLADVIASQIGTNYSGDCNHIRQILLNLLGNAIKFTSSGMITVRVEKIAASPRETVKFSIVDTGRGIAATKIGELFKPFSQIAAQSESVIQGTGLGLSICKGLVELLGGTIGVESVVGQGSTFWFAIPLLSEEYRAPVRTNFARKQAHIFSENINRANILREQMQLRGITPNILANFDDVLNLSQSHHGDVLLLDMPRDSEDRSRFSKQSVAEKLSTVFLGRVSDRDSELKGRSKIKGALLQQEIYQELAQFFEMEPAQAPPLTPIPDVQAHDSVLFNLKAMVVDDNKLNRDLASRMLKILGMRCSVYEDAAAAIAALRTEHFDVVLMDCKMPDMDGFEATRILRSDDDVHLQTIPVIAVTANAFKEDKRQCLEAGMDMFLSKPIMLNDLKDVLRMVITQKKTVPLAIAEDFSEFPRINPEVFASLKELEDPEDEVPFVDGLIETYIHDAPMASAQLITAATTRNIKAVEHYSHKLKGLSRNLGASRLSEICDRIERAATAAEPQIAESIVRFAVVELDAVITVLHGFKSKKAA